MNKRPQALIILDGFGYRDQLAYNAILRARTPMLQFLFNNYPYTYLQASGKAVGLPAGSMGNSEVGHLTIGAGRIIKQPISLINDMIKNGLFCTDSTTEVILKKTIESNSTIHVMGLLSDANVHSNYTHLDAFLKLCAQKNYKNVIIHPFLDGRDTPPRSAAHYLQHLQNTIENLNTGKIGTLHGRFYSMDRDHNWDRTEKSYQVLTTPKQSRELFSNWQSMLESYYAQSITDEFIPPTAVTTDCHIKSGDCIFFFNTRPDRARQLTAAFINPKFNSFTREKIVLHGFITPVPYDKKSNLPTHALLKREAIQNTLKEVLNNQGYSIVSVAETEKYAHITYFFNGEKEDILSHEERILIKSIPAHNYIEHPQMSAPQITDAVIDSLTKNLKDFYLINYANADMVGHSGSLEATVEAIECIDQQISTLYDHVVKQYNGILYITADHGNAETMFDTITHQPHTSHTTNPVPFILVDTQYKKLPYLLTLKGLSDIAPFILAYNHIPIPREMVHSFLSK